MQKHLHTCSCVHIQALLDGGIASVEHELVLDPDLCRRDRIRKPPKLQHGHITYMNDTRQDQPEISPCVNAMFAGFVSGELQNLEDAAHT